MDKSHVYQTRPGPAQRRPEEVSVVDAGNHEAMARHLAAVVEALALVVAGKEEHLGDAEQNDILMRSVKSVITDLLVAGAT